MEDSKTMEEKKHRWQLADILPATFWHQYPRAVYKCVDCPAIKQKYLDTEEVVDPNED